MTVNLHGISRESFDLIVDEEVSGQATYEKKYVHPEKPGGASGVTVGIGYDCGYSSAATIRSDWAGKIPQPMVDALASCAGIKGDAAFAACNRVRAIVAVPWEAAIEVFSNVSIPKYMASTRKGLPGYDGLTPDCKGALLSLVYNRGASFTTAGDRYSEMRGIRAAMIAGNLAAIPDLFRKMKRLWTNKSVRGVALRREHEAKLFEKGLKGIAAPLVSDDVPETDHDDVDEEAATAPFPAVTAARASADPATVAAVAPEVVPAKRSFLAMVWASIVAAGGAAWDTVSGWASAAWDFFTDHKDDLPGDSSSYLGTAWEYVKHIPTPVWWMAAAGLFVFLALDARKGVKKITESVQTGARQ